MTPSQTPGAPSSPTASPSVKVGSPATDPSEPATTRPTIGVFDSGFGGLTVLRALLNRLPGAHFVYLGDTARLPYGDKSAATVARYAIEAAQFLVGRGAQLLVIACNTATALALPEIRAAVPVPVIGVVEPGAQAALAAANTANAFALLSKAPQPQIPVTLGKAPQPQTPVTLGEAPQTQAPVILGKAPQPQTPVILSEAPQGRSRRTPVSANARAAGTSVSPTAATEIPEPPPSVLILATAATVQSHAYRDTCALLGLATTEKPCPLLVPLVEEGWTDHPVTRDVLRIYLREALAQTTPDAVLLGCTHYPLLAAEITAILRELGSEATVVDSAEATAQAVRQALHPTPDHPMPATFECFATDSTQKFARLGSRFLGRPIPHVDLLDLGG